MATDINRTTSIALPGEVSSEILQKTQESSAVMSLAQQIKLPGLGVTIPVITGDPEAAWVAETAKKPVKRGTLDTKIIQVQCHLRTQQHRAARRLLCAHLAPRGLRKEVLNHEDH